MPCSTWKRLGCSRTPQMMAGVNVQPNESCLTLSICSLTDLRDFMCHVKPSAFILLGVQCWMLGGSNFLKFYMRRMLVLWQEGHLPANLSVPRCTPGISMAGNRILLRRPLISHKHGLPRHFHMQETEIWSLLTHKEFTSVVLLYWRPLHCSSAEYWVTVPEENVWTREQTGKS